MSNMVIRGQLDPESLVVPVPNVIDCSGDRDLVRQEFKDECDPSFILRRFVRTGELPRLRDPISGYFDSEFDLQAAMLARSEMVGAFERLPADERAKYAGLDEWLLAMSKLGVTGTDKDGSAVDPSASVPDKRSASGGDS